VDHMSEASSNTEFVSVAKHIWRIAGSAPTATAIVSERQRITFGDLVARASHLATSLSSTLGGRRGIVAISTDDSVQMIIAALAVWRTGCAYLPVSAAEPLERLNRVLSEADVRVLATNRTSLHGLGGDVQLCFIDELVGSSQPEPVPNVSESVWRTAPEDLAYVIYTSGSTGQPKGVAVTQANLRYLVKWHGEAFDVTPQDKGTQFAALTFDAAVLETWPILAAGASLYIPERSSVLVPERLRDYLVAQGITLCFAVTPIAEQLISLEWPQNTRLRFLLTGADTLRSFPPSGLPFHVVNNYGPTECTVLATSGIVPSERNGFAIPTIGRPIPGTDVYILDSSLQPVLDGDCGQICIAGPGVGAGYIGRPDLTHERFVQNSALGDVRAYLTGDLGRKLPSGEFYFHGRLDDQIKIRGFRIEPSEIVAALRSHPAVGAAAVTAVGSEEYKQLAAYVVLRTDATADDLRSHLAAHVPSYMTPAVFVRLRELPIRANGKVDFGALPAPDAFNSLEQAGGAGELENGIQVQVASILSSLLGGRELRLNDNFFRLGGHSLLAAQVIARIRKTFSVDLPLRTIFESPTVAALSHQIALFERDEKLAGSSSLVKIQAGGNRRAFFCVHAHGWDLQIHHKLAAVLGPEQPFYGLQPSGVIGDGNFDFCVEDLAANYIAEIRRVQPKGPYHLGGYCFGGIVAFEMAQQLRAQGEDVPLLVLMDSFFPGEQADFPIRPIRRTLFWFIDSYLGEFLWRSRKQKLSYLSYLLWYRLAPNIRLRWARTKMSGTGPILHGSAELEEANRRANDAYVPKPYSGRVVLFWGGDYAFRSFHDRRLGWSEVAEGGVEVHVIPGDQRIFLAPRLGYSSPGPSAAVTVVAEKLRKCLQSCRGAKLASADSSSA